MTKTNRVSRCVRCHGTELPEIEHTLPVTIAGQKFELADVMQVCANCKEAYLAPGTLETFWKRAALELARTGARTGEAVRFMRKALALRAQDFADLIGQTAENVSRVENGKIPPDLRTVAILGSLLEDQASGSTATMDKLRALRERKRPRPKIVVSLFRKTRQPTPHPIRRVTAVSLALSATAAVPVTRGRMAARNRSSSLLQNK
jgi:transcriptional regulator with XRE-family HTH domain